MGIHWPEVVAPMDLCSTGVEGNKSSKSLIFVPVVLITSYVRGFALKLGCSQVDLKDVP